MATLKRWDGVEEFRARVAEFLLAREAENNLLFGLIHAIGAGRYDDVELWTLEDGDALTTMALRTPPYNLVIPASDLRHAAALADALADEGSEQPGVNGPAEEARAFAARWTERTGARHERTMAQRMYALREVRTPTDVAGHARPATTGDTPLLADWLLAFEREAHVAMTPSLEKATENVQRRMNDGVDAGWLVWEHEGQVASLAGFSGPTPHGIRVGPVYTPPAQRGHRYASALVAALSARMLARGHTFCFLYTDLANPTSNAIYQRIGYEAVADAAMYRFL